MSRERAQRRAQRERLAAEDAAARAADAERAARRRARQEALTGWLPRTRPGPAGILAARRRTQGSMTFAVLLAVNLLTWFFADSWSIRSLVLLTSLLGAPVLYTLAFRK